MTPRTAWPRCLAPKVALHQVATIATIFWLGLVLGTAAAPAATARTAALGPRGLCAGAGPDESRRGTTPRTVVGAEGLLAVVERTGAPRRLALCANPPRVVRLRAGEDPGAVAAAGRWLAWVDGARIVRVRPDGRREHHAARGVGSDRLAITALGDVVALSARHGRLRVLLWSARGRWRSTASRDVERGSRLWMPYPFEVRADVDAAERPPIFHRPPSNDRCAVASRDRNAGDLAARTVARTARWVLQSSPRFLRACERRTGASRMLRLQEPSDDDAYEHYSPPTWSGERLLGDLAVFATSTYSRFEPPTVAVSVVALDGPAPKPLTRNEQRVVLAGLSELGTCDADGRAWLMPARSLTTVVGDGFLAWRMAGARTADDAASGLPSASTRIGLLDADGVHVLDADDAFGAVRVTATALRLTREGRTTTIEPRRLAPASDRPAGRDC